MVGVGVAGGTGHVGRAIVEAIVATGKHEVLILGRTANPQLSAELGVPILAVDYTNVDALAKTLEEHKVHTVVSAILMMPSPSGELPKEVELIQAADKSRFTKRIISSDWGVPHTKEHISQHISVKLKFDAEKALKKATSLESTKFINGYFMDYWGIPQVKSYMPPTTMVLDIPNNTAAITGSGNTPVVFTHTSDIAKFVAASLDLESWDAVSYIIGDRVTWNEFLRLAEETKRTKFTVAYDSLEKLQKGQVTELPGHERFQQFAATIGQWYEMGVMDFRPETSLNDCLPQLQTLKVKELLEKAWQ